ncbi:putative leader peptide [Rhodococcus sp. KBS0724]|uniref:putative leader peptide n=1 Tax=Rhodococcus sp. KBS0724 TaxID=1179674 RepID=UPI0037C564DC
MPSHPSQHPVPQIRRLQGKLPTVQTRHELMLTRRRAVDLCRLGGCCCSCC